MRNDYGKEVDSVGFGEALGVCFKKYFVFEGRAKESEFWYFFLFQLIGSLLTYAILPVLYIVFQLVIFFPYLAVGCRRLHDINKSGFWQLISLTGIGLILLIIWWATDGTTQVKSSNTDKSRTSNITKKTKSKRSDLTDELEDLQELYEEGTLSEEQFKKAKNKLLK
tara:strand:- start:1023 stop:1523 length:501 start_codon:yes stop_codon:yes gene_type:complete